MGECPDCKKFQALALQACQKEQEKKSGEIEKLQKRLQVMTITGSVAAGVVGKDAMNEIVEIVAPVQQVLEVVEAPKGNGWELDTDYMNIPVPEKFEKWKPPQATLVNDYQPWFVNNEGMVMSLYTPANDPYVRNLLNPDVLNGLYNPMDAFLVPEKDYFIEPWYDWEESITGRRGFVEKLIDNISEAEEEVSPDVAEELEEVEELVEEETEVEELTLEQPPEKIIFTNLEIFEYTIPVVVPIILEEEEIVVVPEASNAWLFLPLIYTRRKRT